MRHLANIDPRLNIDSLNKDNRLLTYINFSGNFTEQSGETFCKDLYEAENKAKKLGQAIIPIVINSYGGAIDALMSMMEAINNCSLPVATIVSGKAMSCGTLLFSCGKEGHRYVGEHSRVMIHEVSSVAIGKNDEIKSSSAEVERLNEKLFNILDANCKKEKGYFQDVMYRVHKNSDWFLTPEECVKHNLANFIGIPTLKVNVKMNHEFGL